VAETRPTKFSPPRVKSAQTVLATCTFTLFFHSSLVHIHFVTTDIRDSLLLREEKEREKRREKRWRPGPFVFVVLRRSCPAARPVLLRWVLQTLLDVFFHVMKLLAKSATALLRFRGFASGVHRVSSYKRGLLQWRRRGYRGVPRVSRDSIRPVIALGVLTLPLARFGVSRRPAALGQFRSRTRPSRRRL
jgi:hypothetical protein